MNRSGIVCACALMLSATVPADTAVWLPEGTGGWSSPERWEDGKVPTPSAESPWTVKIPDDASAVVTDADKAYFEALGQLTLGSNSVLTVTNDADLALSCPLTAGLDMRIVKLGSGTFTLRYTKTKYQFNTEKAGSTWDIRDGVLAVDSCDLAATLEFRCPVGVWAPGVLRLDSVCAVQLRGLYGDGTVNIPNTLDEPLSFASNAENSPNDFSGSFTGGAEGYKLKITGAYQKISNPDVAAALKFQLYGSGDSHLALAAFSKTIQVRQNSQVEYIGSAVSMGGAISFMNQGYHLKLNAGPAGETEFTTKITPQTAKMNIIEFMGDNTACSVFDGTIKMEDSECAAYIKKTGAGTWRLMDGAGGNHGTVAVEEGCLEFETVAERGVSCSLGTANLTHSEYTGTKDDTKAVSYACLIGDGAVDRTDKTVPTLCYVGAEAKSVTTRAVAVKGVGCLSSEEAALDWTGFSSVQSGDNTLVLGGAAVGSVARGMVDGIGILSVEKIGAGTWTLDGELDFSGGIAVKAGTLDLVLETEDADTVKLQSVASVSVSEGATLVSDKQVPAGGIVFDASEGAGTVDGFSFPETGCLEIKGKGTDLELAGTVEIPFTFRNCADVSNIAKWTLSMDGEDVKEGEFLISAGPSGITAKYLPPGFQIVIR